MRDNLAGGDRRDRLEETLQENLKPWHPAPPPARSSRLSSDRADMNLLSLCGTDDSANRPVTEREFKETVEAFLSLSRSRVKRPLLWNRTAAALLCLLPVLLGIAAFRHYQNWNRIHTALNTAPGIDLIHSSPWTVPLSFSGSHDPLAPNSPREVLALAGINAGNARLRFTHSLSSDPVIALHRASEFLNPPESVTLEIEADTLSASGAAPREWINTARSERYRLGPGLHLDFSNLTDTDLASCRALADQLVTQRIAFEPYLGATARPAIPEDSLHEIAGLVHEIQHQCRAAAIPLEIRFIGRYIDDEQPFGPDHIRHARERAETVRDLILATRPGIDPARCTTAPDHPLFPVVPHADLRNRSVEFAVVLDGDWINPPTSEEILPNDESSEPQDWEHQEQVAVD